MDIKDIMLDESGDFMITETGDLKIIEGEKAINESIYRRIKTPEMGYQKWVRYEDGLMLLDKDYGNPVYSYLSSPITSDTADILKKRITNALKGEKRIEVRKLSVEPKLGQLKIDIYVEYIIKGESEIRNLNYTLTNNT